MGSGTGFVGVGVAGFGAVVGFSGCAGVAVAAGVETVGTAAVGLPAASLAGVPVARPASERGDSVGAAVDSGVAAGWSVGTAATDWVSGWLALGVSAPVRSAPHAAASSSSEKHGWPVVTGMMG